MPNDLLIRKVRALLAQAQALSSRLAALNEVAAAVQSSLDIDEVLRTFNREARWVLDYQACSIAFCEGDTYTERVLDLQPSQNPKTRTVPLGGDSISRVLRNGHSLVIDEICPGDAIQPNFHSAILLPLRRAGTVFGSLNFYARTPFHYKQDDLRVAYALSMQLSAVLHNSQLFSDATRSRDKLNTVLETISDGVLVLDQSAHILVGNRAFCRMFSISESLVGRHVNFLLRTRDAHGRRILNRSVVRSMRYSLSGQATGVAQLGNGVHVEWAIVPLASTDLNGYVITLHDVSNQVELEMLRDDMIAMLVHDLRTPLSSLIMGLDLLEMGLEEELKNPDSINTLRQIQRSSHRLLHQVTAILDVRKLEAGKPNLMLEPTKVSMLMDKALVPLQALFQQLGQEVVVEIDRDLPTLYVDVSMVIRVLENLFGNANKFTPLAGKITVRARQVSPDFVEIVVADSGPGIPLAQREHIFEKYVQIEGHAARKGIGLGLHFCRLAIESHGGRIGLHCPATGGSEFWITLPVFKIPHPE